ALPDVRGGHFIRTPAASLLLRQRPEGGRHRARRARFRPAPMPSCAGHLSRYRGGRGGSVAQNFFRRTPRTMRLTPACGLCVPAPTGLAASALAVARRGRTACPATRVAAGFRPKEPAPAVASAAPSPA